MAGQVLGKVTAGGGTHLISNTFYGTCDTAAATKAKIVKLVDTNPNAATLITGMMLTVKFTNTNSVNSPTLTVQTSGGTQIIAAKSIMRYGTTTASTWAGASWRAGAVVSFVYDGTNWVEVSSIDDNSTYSNASLGIGYAVQTNTASATACTANFANGTYSLTTNGIVAVRFLYNVPANATLNINNKGAKAIYYRNAAIKANIIQAGDTATFAYNNTYYHLISIDNAAKEVAISSTEPADAGTKIWIKI